MPQWNWLFNRLTGITKTLSMINRHFLTFLFLSATVSSTGQSFSKKDADSMMHALKATKQGIDRIHLLLNLAKYQVHKPGENRIDFDSASMFINEAIQLNTSIKSPEAYGHQLLVQSYLAFEKGEKEISKKLAENSATQLEKSGSKFHLGQAYYHLSSYYDYKTLEQVALKISFVEKALNSFDQVNHIEGKANCHKMLGDLYAIKGDYEKAIDMTELALKEYESIQHKEMQSIYALLGNMYRIKDNYGMALQYELKALKLAHSFGDTTMQLCQINTILGGIYKDLDNHELAINYFKDALRIAENNNDRYAVSLLILNILNTYTQDQSKQAVAFLESIPKQYITPANELEEYFISLAGCKTYVAAQQFDKAYPYSKILLRLANSTTLLDDAKNNINRVLTSYFFATKQYPNAQEYLARNKKLSVQFRGSLRYALDCKLGYKLDSTMGNYQSAFSNLLIYKTIMDSLFNVTKSRQLQQIEIEYETAKKEDSIKLKDLDIAFLINKNNLQQANLKQARTIKNVTIAGIILAIGILGLVYRQYRHKQQSNKVISIKNEMLQNLLIEKEWLLKEIHHRVKNNLQIVMSLLNSQSAYIDNEPALTAIHDSQHRVHAMSLLHQKLYNTDNVSSIDMSVYIRELASYLNDSFDNGQRIRFEFNVEPLELDISQAVPLGLILNESITNSIKYAFPDGRKGAITISLLQILPSHYELSISDNGIGIPEVSLNKKSGSLGMSLMKGLSEDIDGKFSIQSDKGTMIKVSFLYDPAVKKPGTFVSSIVTNN